MSALNRKLLRDLLGMKTQAAAICLVIASGIATFVTAVTALQSLEQTQNAYYERYRFAEVFAHLKRAPHALVQRIAEIPGVARLQARIVVEVNLDVPGMSDPAIGRIISVPDRRDLGLNDLHLRLGRRIETDREGEVLASEAFALAHGFEPGDSITAVINGRRQRLHIVGIVLSPEYVYQIRPGDVLPDERRFGVFWMAYSQLAPAFDMDGAFNDIALTLSHGASQAEVIERLDELTELYGGLGAYGREDQPSHEFVSNEIKQLRAMSMIVPSIFLSVAAFLLNVVLSRLISTQREQIAALKAFGYRRWEIGAHYLKLALVIAAIGVVIGTAAGSRLGYGLTQMYTRFFHFPEFEYRLDAWVAIAAAGISSLAALAGTIGAVLRAMRLPPAEAMRPEPPANFKPTFIERVGLQQMLSPATRMILRQLERRPVKALLTALGMSLATGILVLGAFMKDALDYVMDIQFQSAQRQDVAVTFVEPVSGRAHQEVRRFPGVIQSEPFRAVATRLRSGHYEERVGIMGLPQQSAMRRLIDRYGEEVPLPQRGLAMSAQLAKMMNVKLGDWVTVEVLEESRPVRAARVNALVDDFFGTSAFMDIDALNRLMREQNKISGVHLRVDSRAIERLYETLKETPQVAGVAMKSANLSSFRETVAQNLMIMRTFNIMFACIIAFGVVYNSIRISLSERSRDLATLRVIGFTRAEVSFILLGELAVLIVLAIPAGLALGYAFAFIASAALQTELFRIPLVVNPSTYAFAAIVVLVAALVSGLLVRRRIDRLNLVAVLKTRE